MSISKLKATTSSEKMSKILFAFDFDHTIINVNVDDWFIDAVPDVKAFEDSGFTCWTDYMQQIFATMHSHGYDREQILVGLDSIKISPAIMAACRAISKSENADAVVISDANTFSIKRILTTNGLGEVFSDVISNPTFFNNQGLFKIDYHHRNHGCPRCPANLCKSRALAPYKVGYDKIVYVGDGDNDICPSLSLSSNDIVIARKGLNLANHVNDNGLLKARLHIVDFNETLVKTVQDILL